MLLADGALFIIAMPRPCRRLRAISIGLFFILRHYADTPPLLFSLRFHSGLRLITCHDAATL